MPDANIQHEGSVAFPGTSQQLRPGHGYKRNQELTNQLNALKEPLKNLE
jgi:hypothetical protein